MKLSQGSRLKLPGSPMHDTNQMGNMECNQDDQAIPSAFQILNYRLRMEPSTVVISRRRHSWPSGLEEECAEEGRPKAFVRVTSAACSGKTTVQQKSSMALIEINQGWDDK